MTPLTPLTTMEIDFSIDDRRILRCPQCELLVSTSPTEGVPNQTLRTCDHCGDTFWDIEDGEEFWIPA